MTLSSLPIGAILAGGEGRRFGSTPKPQARLGGTTLLDRVIARLRPQTAAMVLSVRAAAPWHGAVGLPVTLDPMAEVGPMAGIGAALSWARANYPNVRSVLTVPADCPFIPRDLVAKLSAACHDNVRIAVAASGEQRHHLIALWDVTLADDVMATVRGEGALAVHRFQARYAAASVTWPSAPVDPFFNVNSADDLSAAERYLGGVDQHLSRG
ncbi:MAG: molybdenum cofactor guanylyltransferase [Rhodospirillaceae bacterium]|nr:molybdenum cofactor guanylyltransferase [Rhodospirillaceae bacterium]